jgi:2-polyprenyl-3-methyl-5-hydroxy-6-metoxy-1,4-benzoquinol methylase
MKGEDYDAYWTQKSPGAAILSPWQKARADLVVRELKLSTLNFPLSTITIADIGCGDGTILAYIASQIPGARVVGYDSSEVARTLADKSGVHETHHLDVREDRTLSTVAPCDYVLLLETLEHLPDAEEVLRAAVTKAKRGIFFSVPNSGFFTYRLRLLFGKFPAQWIRLPNEHLRFWTLSDMKWWLKALGFTNARVITYEGVPALRRVIPGLFGAGLFVMIRSSRI